MPSDNASAKCQDITLPILRSRNPASADGTQIIPTKKYDPTKMKAGSLGHSAPRCNVKNEVRSITFQISRGQTPAFKNGSANTISGRWTPAEHEAFLQGLKVYGREWKKVATCIPTRTSAQIRSHAQKYFAKVSREHQHILVMTEQHRSAFTHGLPPKSDASFMNGDQPKSQHFIDTVNSIVKNPSSVETRVCQTLASLRERYEQLEIRHKPEETTSLEITATVGPATAALEKEQNSLRKAAVARYELKSRENRLQNRQRSIRTENKTSCAHVSLSSMPSHHGGFDSSDVLALSMLGGSLCKRKIENKTISTIKDDSNLKLVQEQCEVMERPTKLRKTYEQ